MWQGAHRPQPAGAEITGGGPTAATVSSFVWHATSPVLSARCVLRLSCVCSFTLIAMVVGRGILES